MWLLLGVLLIGTFLSVAVHNTATVTLPSIASEFGSTLAEVQWVTIAIGLSAAAVAMPAGYLGDRYSRKQLFTAGMILLAGSSVAAGLAPSLGSLVIARGVQGIGTAMVGVTSIAIAVTLFPASDRGKVLGITSATVGFSALVAPAVGGILVDALGWRWAYHALAVPAVVGGFGAWLLLNIDTPYAKTTPFDWIGATTLAIGVTSLVLAMANGPSIGWSDPTIWGLSLASIAMLGVHIRWELKVPHPLFDLRLLRRRAVATCLGSRVVLLMAFAPAGFLVPFYVQGVMGLSARDLGFILIPGVAAYTVVAALAGRLSDRWTPRPFLIAGPLFSVAGLLSLAWLGANTPLVVLVGALMIHNVSLALLTSPSLNGLLTALPPELHSVGVGFINTTGTVTSMVSVTLITAVVTGVMTHTGTEASINAITDDPSAVAVFLNGWLIACLLQAGFALIAGVIGYMYPKQYRTT